MTSRAPRPGLGLLIARAMRRRCPRCGGRGIFRGWFKLSDSCSHCGYGFSREEGYWVGALVVNIAVAEAWFALLFAVVVLATMPDVEWQPLLIVALITNTLVPVVFYPFSKTLWMAIDMHLHPLPSSAEHAAGPGERTP